VPLQPARAAKDLIVGFIHVGPKDDYGYNQVHVEAAAMLKKIPGVKIIEEEKCQNPSTCPKRSRA
jgi:simple sugar transport system substrate-binding protein